ncbi:MAG: hypothetical protein HOD72_05585 [Opitutae bacterium]|nr:hypothetical protein [Opitutae bacterium]
MQTNNVVMPLRERVRGQWPHILSNLGVDDAYLQNRHSPCPHCGGKDRYRFDDKNGSGSFYCSGCGPGDGFTLLMRVHGWSFAVAAREIEVAMKENNSTRTPVTQEGNREKSLHKMLAKAVEVVRGDEVYRYLQNRGLKTVPDFLLAHPNIFDVDSKRGYPGMLAPIKNSVGDITSIHRTFLRGGEKAQIRAPKKIMPPVGTINGASAQLYPVAEHIGLTEGIETAIACHELFDIPVWAALNTNGIKTFVPPEGVREITVYGDNDKNFTGQSAAYQLANRLGMDGLTVNVKVPVPAGCDWLDVYQELVGLEQEEAECAHS